MSPFISDGFTLTLVIKARGPFADFAVKYRLAMPERIYQWRMDAGRAADGKSRLALDLKLIADHVVQWDAEEPINEVSLRRLPPFMLTEIMDAISGLTFSEQAEAEKN